jgi:predicted Rossmann fold flavoprotein
MLPPGILVKKGVKDIQLGKERKWTLVEEDENTADFDAVVIATGSSEQMWKVLARLEVPMTPRVPSLFTFNIEDDALRSLAGLALPVNCRLLNSSIETHGPMLITHWGLSGPAILKMSAYAAIELAKRKYQFKITIHSLPLLSDAAIEELLLQAKKNAARKQIRNYVPFQFPIRWWQYLLGEEDWTLKNWADLNKVEMQFCIKALVSKEMEVIGKSIFKEEFVTAGGVDLKSVNFKTMESKTHPGIYFVGEVLNIDGVTGGFNFQSCWTTGFLAAQAIGYGD